MKKVCLDPGHGVETAGKRSPDGSYREYEFSLDMAYRMKPLLERHGVEVTLTRLDEHDVSLAQRVKTANAVKGLDLFVSLHSNAAGSGGEWTSARGLSVYVYASDSRSTAAGQHILDRQVQAGVTVRNGGKPNDGSKLYVVRKTNAPAVLVEHLFHDNEDDVKLLLSGDYRQKMAQADAKGILDYLGIVWQEESDEKEEITMDENVKKEPADWAEAAWDKATAKGVMDGARPWEAITRQEVAVILDRLGLLEEAEGA